MRSRYYPDQWRSQLSHLSSQSAIALSPQQDKGDRIFNFDNPLSTSIQRRRRQQIFHDPEGLPIGLPPPVPQLQSPQYWLQE